MVGRAVDGADQMRLVDDENVNMAERLRLIDHRLDAADGDRESVLLASNSGGHDPDLCLRVNRAHRLGVLHDELAPMRRHNDATAVVLHQQPHDLTQGRTLTRSRGHHDQRR